MGFLALNLNLLLLKKLLPHSIDALEFSFYLEDHIVDHLGGTEGPHLQQQ